MMMDVIGQLNHMLIMMCHSPTLRIKITNGVTPKGTTDPMEYA